MADLTLEQLLAEPSKDLIREQLFGHLNADGFPVTDFEEGAIVRTIAEATAEVIADHVANMRPKIASAGFSQEAADDWLTLKARQDFDLERQGATYTIQSVRLWADLGVGPETLAAGDLTIEAPTGNRYVLNEGGTIPIGTSLGSGGAEAVDFVTLEFKAESPGSKYSDPETTLTRLITPLPGIHAMNIAPTFSSVVHTGTGTGTVALTGTPPSAARFTLRILTTGQAGVATFEYSLNGAPYAYGGLASSSGVVLPGGTVAAFTNGVNPSFKVGDTYTFNTPGSPIVEQGRDAETDARLQQRIADRWPSLSENALDETYKRWAQEASSEVTKVKVEPENSDSTPGRVRVVIAGAVNPLSGAVAVVQAYLDARHPIGDDPVAEAADAIDISAYGSVTVKAEDLARIQTEAQLAWQTYLNELDLGGTVRMAELAELLMDAGAVDFFNLHVGPTGDPSYASHTLAVDEVARPNPGATLATELTWISV